MRNKVIGEIEFIKVFVFKNRQTGWETKLFQGFKRIEDGKDIPVYQLASKEIPITGDFTGYPPHIVCNWMDKIGYELETTVRLGNKNKFRF